MDLSVQEHKSHRVLLQRPAACWGALPAMFTGGSNEVIPPLHWDLVKLYLKSWAQFWPPQCQRKTLTYWNKSTETAAWCPQIWSILHKRGCRTHLFCLRKRKISKDLTIAFSYFMKAGMHNLTLPGRGTKDQCNQVAAKKIQPDTQKKIFTTRIVQHWSWGFRRVVNSPSLETGSALKRWSSEPLLIYIIHQFCDVTEESIESACWSYINSTLILYIHLYSLHSLNIFD